MLQGFGWKLTSSFCRGCLAYDVFRSAGVNIEGCWNADCLLADEGLAPKALSGICLGTMGLAHDSSLKEKAEGEQGIYAIAGTVAPDDPSIGQVILGASKRSHEDGCPSWKNRQRAIGLEGIC